MRERKRGKEGGRRKRGREQGREREKGRKEGRERERERKEKGGERKKEGKKEDKHPVLTQKHRWYNIVIIGSVTMHLIVVEGLSHVVGGVGMHYFFHLTRAGIWASFFFYS